jgi:hypothetical protein
VRHAAEEVVLRLVERDQPGVLLLHAGVQLRVAQGSGDLDGIQLEQVLVRALPRPGCRDMPDEQPQDAPGRGQGGPDRARLPGDHLLLLDRPRIAEQDLAVDHAEGGPCPVGGSPGEHVRSLLEGGLCERIEDPAQLAVPALQHVREPVVALGEPAELVVPGQLQVGGQVTGRDPLHGPRDLPQRCAEIGREDGREQDGEHDRDGDGEQEDPGEGGVAGLVRAGDDDDDDAEPDHGQDRRGDQPQGQAGSEAEPGPRVGRLAHWSGAVWAPTSR